MNMRMFTGALLVTEDFLKTLICTVCQLDFNKTGEKKNQGVYNMCINSKDNKKQRPPPRTHKLSKENNKSILYNMINTSIKSNTRTIRITKENQLHTSIKFKKF